MKDSRCVKSWHLIVLLLVILVAFPIAWSHLLSVEPTNYCRDNGRLFSDRDYIKIAVKVEALHKGIKDIQLRHTPIQREVMIEPVDGDVEIFLNAHSDCCHVYKKQKIAFLEKLFSTYPITVRVVYDTGVKSTFEGRTIFYEAYVDMNECGKTGPSLRGSI